MPSAFRSPNPWVKATAFSAAGLTISLGLCGLNAAAFSYFHLDVSGPHVPGHDFQEGFSLLLVLAALLESTAILLCGAALIVSSLILLLQFLFRSIGRQ